VNTKRLDDTSGDELSGGNNASVPLQVDFTQAYYVVAGVPEQFIAEGRFDDLGEASDAAVTTTASGVATVRSVRLCEYRGMQPVGGSPFTTLLLASAPAVSAGAAAMSRVLEPAAGRVLPVGASVQAAAGGAAELRVQMCAANGRSLDLGSVTQGARLAVVATPPLPNAPPAVLVYSGVGGVYYARVPVRAVGSFALAVTVDGVPLGGAGSKIALEVGPGPAAGAGGLLSRGGSGALPSPLVAVAGIEASAAVRSTDAHGNARASDADSDAYIAFIRSGAAGAVGSVPLVAGPDDIPVKVVPLGGGLYDLAFTLTAVGDYVLHVSLGDQVIGAALVEPSQFFLPAATYEPEPAATAAAGEGVLVVIAARDQFGNPFMR
jgi:hypothetical protein